MPKVDLNDYEVEVFAKALDREASGLAAVASELRTKAHALRERATEIRSLTEEGGL